MGRALSCRVQRKWRKKSEFCVLVIVLWSLFAPVLLEYWLLFSNQLIPHRPSVDVNVQYCTRLAVDFVGNIS